MDVRAAPNPTAGEASFEQDWSLTVVLRLGTCDPPLARERVTDADLVEARSEAWFEGHLRGGFPQTPYQEIETRLAPITATEADAGGGGFLLRARCRGTGRTSTHRFSTVSLSHVADRAATRLLAEGVLRESDTYVYEVLAERGPAPGDDPALAADGGLTMTATIAPLGYVTTLLAPLLDGARQVGPVDGGDFPVLFEEAALAKARRFARKGAASIPPVETGCVLLGEVCACPGGEMFVVVRLALEVRHAEQEEFALIYTAKTWDRVQTILRCYATGVAGRGGGLRLVGQAHGHNFAVQGGPCAICATAKECPKTTVFVSEQDRRFMRAVFAKQPWALCWIAGSNARGEDVEKLFTLRGGVLRERGYHVLPRLPGPLPDPTDARPKLNQEPKQHAQEEPARITRRLA